MRPHHVDESERRFHAIADAAPSLIWTADADGRCTWLNAPWLAFTGRTLDEALGDGWQRAIHPDDVEHCLSTYQAGLAARVPFEIEYRLQRRAGDYRWLLDRAVPRFDEYGAFDGVISMCIDISERHALLQAERAARHDGERARARLVALQAVTSAMGQAHTAAGVGEKVMQHGLTALGANRGSLMLLDSDRACLLLVSISGYPDAMRDAFARVPLAERYPMTDCIRTGRPVLLPSGTERDHHYPALAGMRGTDNGALAAVPLQHGGRVIGAMGATWVDPRAFDADEEAFLVALADQAALALERARLFDAEQAARAASERQLRSATLLQRVTGALSRALTPQAVADVVLTEGAAALKAALGSVNVIDADGDTVRTVASMGWAPEHLWPPFSLAETRVPMLDVVQTQQPVYIARAEEWEMHYPQLAPFIQQVGIVAAVTLPVAFEGRVQGIISFCWRHQHEPSLEERALLDALAAQCAQAWERARLFAAAEDAQHRAEFLADATHALASSLEYETTLAHVASTAVPRLADWCVVDIVEDPECDVWPPALAPVIVMHTDPAKIAWARSLRERDTIKWDQPTGLPAALRSGATQFIPQLTDDMLLTLNLDPEDLARAREVNLSAYLCVPLRARGRTLGALTLCMAESGRHYTVADRVLAEQLAQRAATAIDNARLLRDAERERSAAEAANQAKVEFLTVMSHELRTPLNAISGYAQLLELGIHGPISDAQRTTLNRIQHNQHRLLTMINEVLNYARLEAATVQYALADVPMPALLQAVEPLVRPQADAKGLTLTFEECLADVVVRADPEKLQQVLVNLLSNAIKFTHAGGTVTISCVRRGPGADPAIAPLPLVDIVVRDTGIGVAPEQLERIFEPFVQLGRSLYGPGEGTGLGLAISRDLARGMGGELGATSTVGQGSRFTLTLASVG